MYQLVSAIVKPLTGDGRWKNMDISGLSMSTLFGSYKSVIAILSNNFLDHNVSFDIEPLRAKWAASDKPFIEFLYENGNLTLPTSDELPVINTRYAHFADAFHAKYEVVPVHATAAPDAPMPDGDKTYALLKKDGIDYTEMYKHCLVNINGFYHQTDHSSYGLYVTDAMKSVWKSGRNQIGILSMKGVSSMSFLPITEAMIHKQNDDQVLKNNCYIDTGLDLTEKTVMLVLGGYLHLLDRKTFKRVSPSTFKIDFSNLPLVDRFYESVEVIDLSSLGLDTTVNNPTQVGMGNLFSDAVLKKYLQLSQTFFVILDNKDIFIDEVPLRRMATPNTYITKEQPIYPMRVGCGRHEPYWYRKEHGQFAVAAKGVQKGNKIYNTRPLGNAQSVSDTNQPLFGYGNDHAAWIKIGTDI